MTGSSAHLLLPTPPSAGTNAAQSCGVKPWPLQIMLTKTINDGHVHIVGLRTTFMRAALARPLVTAHNTLSQLTSEYPELQCVAILTMDIAQETPVLSNVFACHARPPTPESCVWTEQTRPANQNQ